MFKILIVDDEPAIREMISAALALFGWQASAASDGVEAMECLARENFHMVLSDINMPRMGGFELLRRVEAEYPKIKRVLMSAYNLDDYMRMVRDHNVGNVIAKTTPLDFKELRDILSSLLHESIFGIERYMLEPHKRKEFLLQEPSQIDTIADAMTRLYAIGIGAEGVR